MSRWWQQDMSDASQGLFSDPSLALQIASMPDQVLQQNQAQQQAAEQTARQAKSGFLSSMMDFTKSVGGVLDGAMSTLIGDNATNKVEKSLSAGGKAIWYPVDKTASGAYWLYSNGVSQPLSTVLLMAATGQGSGVGGKDKTSYFSASDWAKSWHEANKLSPAQVVFNAENTYGATGNNGLFTDVLGNAGQNLDPAEKARVQQQSNKFINDTAYWRNQQGWTYTVGTGALDFMTSMGLDPTYAGLKVVSSGVKGLRSVRITGAALDAATKSRSGTIAGATVDKLANGITKSLAKSPAEASQSENMTKFFDWTHEPSADGITERKTGWEIAQHPIWGTGRRVNPARYQLSEILSQADRTEQPMIFRFATGDNTAAQQLAVKNSDLLRQVGRLQDNRVAVDSAKFDPNLFEHFMQQERLGATAPGTAPGIGGNAPSTLGNRIVEPPYPRPTTPGPRQAGWDATYGDIAKTAAVNRAAAGSILTSGNGVRPMGGAAGTTLADQLRFQEWRTGQLADADSQIQALQQKSDIYSQLLGGAFKDPSEFTPGGARLFGTMDKLYRMGPLAGNTEKAANKSIIASTRDRTLNGVTGEGGFVARTLRKSYYGIPVRVVQSFGDRLPQTLINHNDEDASQRVLDMLKRVPGLGQEARLGMVNMYDTAGDKVAKSAALKQIQTDVIRHMADQHNLDEETGRAIADIVDKGITSGFDELKTGRRPTDQMFSAAQNSLTGQRADKYQDGEAWMISPLAKTQLSYSDPLLDVQELDRFLGRHSTFLRSARVAGGKVYDGLLDVTDSLSNVWKAATLLRPGYMLRAPSEEIAAGAVKFGLMSSIMMSAHGGKNWALNRGQQLKAVVGQGDYASTVGGKTRIRILDPEAQKTAAKLGQKTTRINVNDAWPVVMDRIDREKSAASDVQKQIDAMKKDPNHDPNELAALHDDLLDHNDVIDEFTDYYHELLRAATDSKGRRLGEGTIEHQGIEIPQAFSKQWDNPIPRDQITSDEAMKTAFARSEAIDTGRMMKTGHWTAVTPDQPNYMESMLDALNKQFGQDDLFKLVAEDPTLKTAQAWLKTPAGRYHLGALGPISRTPDELLQGIKDTLEHYTASNPVLMDKISRGEQITEAEVRGAIRKEDFPPVHGEEVLGLTKRGRTSTASGLVDNIIAKGFNRLGTIPTDILSRHPTYLRAQEARMRQLVDQELSFQKSLGQAGDSIAPSKLNQMLQKSDKMAREDIKSIVYDPTRTTATQALRFIAPFLSAHIDGLERWGGLVAEQPQFVGTAARIYNAPVAANLVTDQDGNAVDQNGYVTLRDENGKITGKKFVGMQDRTIHFKMPFGMNGKPKAGGFEVPIKIQSLNTILPGDPWWNPGTGPIVSIAASQLAKKDPGFGDFLQWAKVLPYGPQSLAQSVTPAYLKNVWDAYHPDSDKFQQAMLAEYQRQVADHANGGPLPDMDRAEKNAKNFMKLKALTSWLSPAQVNSTPLTGTPYQFYVDQYKKMEQVDPKNADANFLNKFGEDYFIFTTSLSKSMGIAPTVSALSTAKEYKDLIAGDPSLAPFIIGDVYNQGDFSQSAYYDENNMKIGGQAVRGKQSVQDAVADNQRRLGWAEYTKIMNTVDANLIRSGFHSYQQAGAEQFNQLKQQLTSQLKQLYPAWEEDFDTTDTGLLPRRIQSFEILVQDPRLKNDPMRTDIRTMTQYLAYRQIFKQELAARGVSQLSVDPEGNPFGPNADLGQAWRQVQTGLLASDTKFADTFNRYLSHDNLQ